MAQWKKVLVSGSNIHVNEITASSLTNDNLVLIGTGGSLESSGLTYDGSILDITAASVVYGSLFSGSFVGDGSGLTGLVTTLNITGSDGGETYGSVDLLTQDLTVTAGEGIDITVSNQNITFSGEYATTDNNKGIASFDSGDFVATSGNITLANSLDGAVLAINGTTNETTVSRTLGTVTVGLPDDVTITNSLTVPTASITGNLFVDGDLAVNGDLTYINTANLFVEDKFILLNSGSANPDEGGIIIDEGLGLGHAFFYEADRVRWGFNQSVSSTATTADTTAYAAAVVDVDGPHTDISEYQKNGNIKVEGGEIYIFA
jgi:hypothetical protein